MIRFYGTAQDTLQDLYGVTGTVRMCRVNVVAMDAVLSILLTRYMHVHRFMCLTQSTWKVVDWTKWQSAVEMVSWALRM